MQYIALIHSNAESPISSEEWGVFIEAAIDSRHFVGGSEMGARELIGREIRTGTTESVGGFMRFDSDSRQELLRLLQNHPVIVHGGTIELYELPRS